MTRLRRFAKTTVMVLSAASLLALSTMPAAGEPVRLLLLTGGHPYDLDEFHAMFDNMADVEVTHVELEDHSEVFEDIAAWPYDTIVFYNMTQEMSDRRLENLFTLTEWGVGIVPLHHGTLSWFTQPRIKEIFGVQFPDVGPFGFHLHQTFTYQVVDSNHPVTDGMEDWEILDETYTNWYGAGVEGNRVLIRTDHQPSDPELVWARHVNNARILSIQGGHDRFVFENPHFNDLLYRAAMWTSGRLPLEVGGEGLPNSTIYREYFELPALIGSFAEYDASESRAALVAVEDRLAAGQGGEILVALAEVAKDETRSMAVRTWSLRQLGYHGMPASLDAVAGLLLQEDMANIARYAMEKSVHRRADEILMEAFHHSEGEIRQGIAITMTARESPGVLDALISLLESEDPLDVQVAARSLGKLGGGEALGALEKKAAEAGGETLLVLQDALLSWAARTGGTEAARLYGDLRVEAGTDILRGKAWRGYLTSPSATADDLADALGSEEDRVRQGAIRALVTIDSDGLVQILLDRFASMDEQDQLGVLYALEERNDVETLPLLHAALAGGESVIRTNALYVAGSLGSMETGEALIDLLGDLSPADRSIAVESLAHLRDEGVDDLLVASLKDESAAVRAGVLEALEQRVARAKLEEVFPFTDDPSPAVRSAAYSMLGQLGDDAMFERVLELFVAADSGNDQRLANRTLIDLRRRSERQDEQLEKILQVLPGVSESQANLLIGTIATGSTDAAAEALRRLIESDTESLRLAAIRSLSNWPTVVPAETLLKVAEAGPPRESALATRGYLTLLSRDGSIRSEDRLNWALRVSPHLTNAGLKTQYISVVASTPSLNALNEVVAFLEDEEVQREAFLAIQQLAPDLSLVYPGEVLAALQQIANSDALGVELREMARERIDFLAEYSQRVLANWNFFEGTDGWIAENQSVIEARGGILHATSQGVDPFISTRVEIEEQPLILQFRVRHEEEPRLFQFFLRTTELSMGDPGSILSIQPRRSNGDWVEYEIPFRTEGTIEEFRFDFAIVPDVTVEIDYIRIMRP